MKAEGQDEAPSTKPDENRGVRPIADKDQARPETDVSRTGKGSGASGGGSFGNLPGDAVTGGSPEFGPRETGAPTGSHTGSPTESPNPAADEAAGDRNDDDG
jgi:hypothetical protein